MSKLSITVSLLTILLIPIAAQQDTHDERLSKIESIISKLPTISGYVNPRFQYSDLNDMTKFDIRRARLDLRGNITKAFDYKILMEFAGSPKLLDAYFRWKPTKIFNIQFGQFKLPFSLENPYNPTNLETIDNSIVISRLSGYSDESAVGANGRDIGLAFYGGFIHKEGYNVIDYYVGLFNGNGINTGENNKSKDFSGRLSINPTRDITIALSHINGNTTRDIDGVATDFQRVRSGIGVRYDNQKLLLRSEYIIGKTEQRKSEGFYVTAGYFVATKLQPVLKFDYYKSNKSLDKTQLYYTVGVNYYPVKPVRLQLNYVYRTGKEQKNENYITAQAVVSF